MNQSGLRMVRALLIGSAAVTALVSSATGQTGNFDITVRSLPLADALRAVARQTHSNILFAPVTVTGVQSPAISGHMDAFQAAQKLTKGTGLDVVPDGPSGIVVRRTSWLQNTSLVIADRDEAQRLRAPFQHAVMQAPNSVSGGAPVESVTVTGSRIISDITLSPTPITAVSIEQLQATTPTNIPDALNKLPIFANGRSPRSQDNAGRNAGGNVLNLRNFGVARTLVLLNGHRVPASNQDGTVDIDTLPQMLVSRVDVVTGGASAVYGSDAVAGVVNFILDTKFTGFKYNVNAGISKYGDAAEWQAGFAWGTELLGGRGHFEMAAKYFNQDMVPIYNRPYGYNGNAWIQTGNGTAAAPFTNTPFGRAFNQATYGTIVCGAACPAQSMTFGSPGGLSPLSHGGFTTTTNFESGGGGGYNYGGTWRSKIRTGELFARFGYDITDDLNAYVQTSWSESGNFSNWSPLIVSPANNRPNSFFSTNPYLTPAAMASLGAGFAGGAQVAGYRYLPAAPATSPQTGTTPPPPPANTPFFQAPGFPFNKIDGKTAVSQNRVYNTQGLNRNLDVEAGLAGTLMRIFSWDAYYNHGENRLQVVNPHNTDQAKYLAAQDAVIAPAGTKVNGVDISGTATCWVTTQAQFAALYPGCQPLNLFDPVNGPTASAYDYISRSTAWQLTQTLDNIGGSIHGGLWGLGLPAGEITAALSGEARWATYDMKSNALPTDFVDCTGLRMCLANGNAPVKWVQNVNAPVSARNNVYEAAAEINVPLLKDVPMFKNLSTDLAGRYTNYSTSGEAYTWKIGANWQVEDNIRFRGTASVDIRAPNLNDLFQPAGLSTTGFTDLLTNVSNSTQLQSSGNSKLVPEVAHTHSVGVVLTPTFIPGLLVSVDWYKTAMSGAITNTSFTNNAIQQFCNASAPAYNSPYCTLVVRPLPVGDPNYTSAANYPSRVLSAPANSAKVQMEGFDIEIDYGFDLGDIMDGLPGSVNFRHLATYEPVNQSYAFLGAPVQWNVFPKTRQTTFIQYNVDNWGLSLQNQWMSGFKKASGTINQNYAAPRIGSVDTLDVTVDRRFDTWGGTSDLYFTVSNIGNTRAPLWPTNTSNPGLRYPIADFSDDMGRYFTIGIRGNL
jgi:iron complex outermembrane receptor protein